jgi:hypothetical protein
MENTDIAPGRYSRRLNRSPVRAIGLAIAGLFGPTVDIRG